jgi:hypothetical protein
MPFLLRPWHILLICVAGWINRRQQEMIDYVQAENQVLKKSSGKNVLSSTMTDDQCRRLAVKGKILGHREPPFISCPCQQIHPSGALATIGFQD